jgi:putative PIN family toxin of toxin-antitoxin system
MRVLLDTNILVRANPKASGSARALFAELTRSSEHTLILSPFLLEEVERVLAYPRLQALWPLTPEEIRVYTKALDDLAEMVHLDPVHPAILGDPKDDPVVATALVGRADVVCTLDRDFYTPNALDYLRRHSILVMSDTQLLLRLRGDSARTRT